MSVATVAIEKKAEKIKPLFDALSGITRIKIALVLLKKETCVEEVASTLKMTHSAISHQLGVMTKAGVVTGRKDGRHMHYSLKKPDLMKYLLSL